MNFSNQTLVRDLDSLLGMYRNNGVPIGRPELLKGIEYRLNQLRNSGEPSIAAEYDAQITMLESSNVVHGDD